MTTLRRFLVLAALMFWQGGFVFYAAVVVPVGRTTIGSEQQSLVTRQVTNYLNLAGTIALLPMVWDVWATRVSGSPRKSGRWITWLGMVAAMPLLVWLHMRLDALLDPATAAVQDYQVFYPSHRLYLWISTGQWALAVLFGVLSLRAWRRADRLQGVEKPVESVRG